MPCCARFLAREISCSKAKSPSSPVRPAGIGLAIARAYAKDGRRHRASTALATPDAIEKERSGIEKDFGVKALYNGADMSKGDEIAAMIADAKASWAAVDILVNNAGIQFVSPIEDFPPAKWDQIIAINLSAPSMPPAPPCRA